MKFIIVFFFILFKIQFCSALEKTYNSNLDGFDYPYKIRYFKFKSQKQVMQMAYMDITPEKFNGKTVVFFHGKNFCSATWNTSFNFLLENGFRIIAMDQIGFCKSSKPEFYQYSFHQLSKNSKNLIDLLNLKNFFLIGHSAGGMLGIRFALMFPELIKKLILINPIGLEDWKAVGVPYLTTDEWFLKQQKIDINKIREYQKSTYYMGTWKNEYEIWVEMLAGMFQGIDKDLVAWHSALTYDMIYTQPVVYELYNLKVPTVLYIGEKDNTAIGKSFSPEIVRKKIGNYSKLAKKAKRLIPNSKLYLYPNLGHAPHIQNPKKFHKNLIKELNTN